MDIFRNWGDTNNQFFECLGIPLKSCAVNGMWKICDYSLWYHLTWYFSMIIFAIFAVTLWSLYDNKK